MANNEDDLREILGKWLSARKLRESEIILVRLSGETVTITERNIGEGRELLLKDIFKVKHLSTIHFDKTIEEKEVELSQQVKFVLSYMKEIGRERGLDFEKSEADITVSDFLDAVPDWTLLLERHPPLVRLVDFALYDIGINWYSSGSGWSK